MRSGPARHVSSPPATASSASSTGASVATIPGAPWHHCVRIRPSPLSSRRIPARLGQLTSPSSSTAQCRSVSETAADIAEREHAPRGPCAGPRYRAVLPYRCCVQRPSGSRRPCNHSMLAVTSSPSSRPARIVPGLPHISSQRSSCSFAAISCDSRSRFGWRGRAVHDEPNSRLAHPEAARDVVAGEVRRGGQRPFQIRDTVPSQLDQAPPGETVERIHDPGASEIDSPEARRGVVRRLAVLGMRGPAVVNHPPRRRRSRRSPSGSALRPTARSRAPRGPPARTASAESRTPARYRRSRPAADRQTARRCAGFSS